MTAALTVWWLLPCSGYMLMRAVPAYSSYMLLGQVITIGHAAVVLPHRQPAPCTFTHVSIPYTDTRALACTRVVSVVLANRLQFGSFPLHSRVSHYTNGCSTHYSALVGGECAGITLITSSQTAVCKWLTEQVTPEASCYPLTHFPVGHAWQGFIQ